MAIDTHTHVFSPLIKYPEREIELINVDTYLDYVINVGLNTKTSESSVLISNEHSKFYSSIGIHPLYIEGENPNKLYKLITDKVVAIGEIGLDNTKDNFLEQKKMLVKQIMIANELGLPVIIHSHNCNKEIINVFENIAKPLYGCVFHCFQPDFETLTYLEQNNFYISVAGKITLPTAKKSHEVLRTMNKDLLLVETDAPYMTPYPFEESINHSCNLHVNIAKIAEVLNMTYEDVETLTTNNAKRLFKKIK